MRSAYTLHAEDDDFGQPGTLYRKVLTSTDRQHLISNIVGHLGQDVERPIQERTLRLWYKVDPELGDGIAKGLGLPGLLEKIQGD